MILLRHVSTNDEAIIQATCSESYKKDGVVVGQVDADIVVSTIKERRAPTDDAHHPPLLSGNTLY